MLDQTFAPETAPQIEARLEADRTALSQSLTALGAKFTPDALWSGGVALLKSNSVPYTQAVDQAIRANPIAVALTAVGLAWLILGRRGPLVPNAIPLPGTHVEAVARWEDEGGPVTETLTETPGTDDAWIAEADQLRRRANVLLAQIDTALRTNTAPTAALEGHRADIIAALTRDVRRAMARGMDHLSPEARALALTAREDAYAAHVPSRNAGTFAALTIGVALATAGATIAALLPQSGAENDALGGPRDHLVDAVSRALRMERQRLAQSVQQLAVSLLADPVSPSKPATAWAKQRSI